MSLYQDVIKEVEDSPEGPQIGAFFDFDGTVIYGFSATTFLKEQIKRGDLSISDIRSLVTAISSFEMGNLGFSGVMEATSGAVKGLSEETYIELGEELYDKHIGQLIYPESRALIEAHLKKGHTVAIISSATPYQVHPAARDLGVERVLCSHYEVGEDGNFTGGVVRPTCFGEGKVIAAEELSQECGVDLQQTFFYSDSDDDLKLLERVGKPRPLNPNKKLTAIAKRKGWPIRSFGSRGKPGIVGLVRTIAGQAALPFSVLAGLPIWAITGSQKKAKNFTTSLVGDLGSAMIGMDMDVDGEQHLWSHRPAIFVYNHQSQADAFIMMSLLRKDFVGIGKKEAGDIPVLGQVFKYLDTVLIDRKNSSSAIEALKPLVEKVKSERVSVLVSPEGERSIGIRLGAFKKGPFHIAMQAGVPMVPVVIHNATDISPKGDFFFRPGTVKVEVLPPVDTSNWSVKTLETHVADVRNMFLKTLGQPEQTVPTGKVAKPKAKVTPKRTGSSSKIRGFFG